jgi:2-isopropylmalate synthase
MPRPKAAEPTCPARASSLPDLHVYDTTLRDGAQQEGLNLSVADKLAIARQLDDLGVGFIEGGWPGANPKDTEFFARAQRELSCATRRWPPSGDPSGRVGKAADDPLVRALLDSGAPVVTLVAKSHTATSSRRCARRSPRTSR